jgi:hypothetical protein
MTLPVPNSPDALLALQRGAEVAAESPDATAAVKLRQVLALIQQLEIGAWECREIALAQLRHLETFHDAVVAELDGDTQAPRRMIARWAIDADRLCQARRLLESVELT